MNPDTLSTYRYFRATGLGAVAAKARALDWLAKGHPVKYRSSLGTGFGAPSDNGLQWVENVERAGLRFVGFADEIVGRGVDHFGWYCGPEEFGETYRGCVYQLPGRKGRARYVPGYREGSYSHSKRTWEDRCGSHSARIDFTDIREGEPVAAHWLSDHYGAHRDAAFTADSIARIEAESEREYQEAWQAGTECAHLLERAKEAHLMARELIRDVRRARGDSTFCERFPRIGETVRKAIREELQSWRDKMRKAKKLAEHYNGTSLANAFADGLGF